MRAATTKGLGSAAAMSVVKHSTAPPSNTAARDHRGTAEHLDIFFRSFRRGQHATESSRSDGISCNSVAKAEACKFPRL
jgi:hypothetical protein